MSKDFRGASKLHSLSFTVLHIINSRLTLPITGRLHCKVL